MEKREILSEELKVIVPADIEDLPKVKKKISGRMEEYFKNRIGTIFEKEGIKDKENIKKNSLMWELEKYFQLENLFFPEEAVEKVKYERLAFPALIGSFLTGYLFYLFLGDFFANPAYSFVLGSPIGAFLFVWLFSKAAGNPKMSSVIKWSIGLGFAGLTIAAVYSNIKGSLWGKVKVNFFQWLWTGILAFLAIWLLHIFKPERKIDLQKRKEIVEFQVVERMLVIEEIISLKIEKLKVEGEEKPSFSIKKKEEPVFQSVKETIDQIYSSDQSENSNLSKNAVSSFISSLEAKGVKIKKFPKSFVFDEEKQRYFDTLGIINIGDLSELIKEPWVANSGEIIFKGLTRKKR